ncbi:MAG: polysaccharide deacetylase family protein [Rhodothermales bacterium]|nr:polysaccharide deacetylase family protein [Rhodothermales bacterium]MBO6779053.1 polysaccharide deacetylase family protein [Rhodothermales bacterium]
MKERLTSLLAAAVLVFAFAAPAAQAQAVDATLTLNQPAPGVAHLTGDLFDVDEPRVALLVSEQARGDNELTRARARDAVYYWEVFLLGLQLPYQTVGDGDVAKISHKDYDLLIMPVADALSSRQRKALLKFVDRGGSVIASGDLATDDRGDTFFAELLGSELVSRVPEQPFGLLHSIDTATPVGQGVPPGFRLNLAPMGTLTAARPIEGMALGTPYSYSGRDDVRLADLTLAVLNRRGDGFAMWTRFGPQDVSRERAHQAAYQRMMVNAMARMTGARTVSVRPWPELAQSALAIAALPTVGFEPLSYLAGWEEFLGLLNMEGMPATFFVTTEEAAGFPDIVAEMGRLGEVAVAGESDNVLLGQPYEVQEGRMARSRNTLGGVQVGIYPPGGYHDGNTLRAAVEGGFNYVLLPGANSLAPTTVRWWEDVDYRSLQATATEQVDLAFLRSRRRAQREPTRREALEPTPAVLMPLDAGTQDYVTRFNAVERAGGLYVLPFYPESERAGSVRTGQLRDVLAMAQERGTWTATVNDILRWWTQMGGISVAVADGPDEEFVIDVTNRGNESVSGVTLELHLGDVGFDNLEGDVGANLVAGDLDGTYLLLIDRLPTGTSRFSLNLF